MSLPLNFNILNSNNNTKLFAAGQTIFSAGEIGEEMYYIKSGEVEIILDGKQLITLSAGDIFGEMALIDDKIRYGTAIATADTEVVAVNEKYFNFLIQEHPYFALNVMRILADRLRKQTHS